MVEGLGRVGEEEPQGQRRRYILTLGILIHPQSSETSSSSSLWLPSTMEREGWRTHLHIKGLRPEVEVETEKVWRQKG